MDDDAGDEGYNLSGESFILNARCVLPSYGHQMMKQLSEDAHVCSIMPVAKAIISVTEKGKETEAPS